MQFMKGIYFRDHGNMMIPALQKNYLISGQKLKLNTIKIFYCIRTSKKGGWNSIWVRITLQSMVEKIVRGDEFR